MILFETAMIFVMTPKKNEAEEYYYSVHKAKA